MSPTGFKIAGAIRSRLHTIFHQLGHSTVPMKDLELMSQMARDHELPAGWLSHTIDQVRTADTRQIWSAS